LWSLAGLLALLKSNPFAIVGVVALIIVIALGIGFLFGRGGPSSAPTPTVVAEEPKPKTYDAPPEMTIDTSKTYYATIKTAKGDIKLELFDDQAPVTVNNFVFLARDGYYDGVTFHRVIEDFMAQAGDPTGTGSGGPGYQFEDEIVPELTFDSAGLLAMANAGPGTNGSQFFITFKETPWLDGKHTIFGKVVEGMEVLGQITRREPGDDVPGDVIQTIVIEEQ